MVYSVYICYTGTVVVPCREDVLLYVRKEDFWLYQQKRKRFNNHNMALMLIDILHSRKLVNDVTYTNIMRRNRYVYQN